MNGLTQTEIKWIKKFIKNQIHSKQLEKEFEAEYKKSEQKQKEYLKQILDGKFIGKTNLPKNICKKCGKIIVKSWASAMLTPEQKYRCKCKKGDLND
jgi:hypothetical protein